MVTKVSSHVRLFVRKVRHEEALFVLQFWPFGAVPVRTVVCMRGSLRHNGYKRSQPGALCRRVVIGAR